MLLEDHLPKIKKLISKSLGVMPANAFRNEEFMRISFRKIYQSMPRMFRLAISEKKFEEFCMSNRDKLLTFGDKFNKNFSLKESKESDSNENNVNSNGVEFSKINKLNTTTELLNISKKVFLPIYPSDLILVKAKKSKLWDSDGKEYIDFGSGISVNSLGHKNSDLLSAIRNQSQKLLHTSNLYLTEPSIKLAEYLVEITFADRVFFCNSGAEANEAAIKIARKYASIFYPTKKREIITFEGSFHGRTLATITATAQPKYQKGFEPLPEGFLYCPFNDYESASKMIGENTCAVMIEPIQGEGGINTSKEGFLLHLRNLCNKHNALLIFDEIQCGLGRTGKLFAYEWDLSEEIHKILKPDILTLAKSLGGGLPIGAMICSEKVSQSFKPGDHGTTFGGNPLVTAVAQSTLKTINSKKMLMEINKKGEFIRERLNTLNSEINIFKLIRGRGMMIGGVLNEELNVKANDIVYECRKNGLLILSAGENVLRILPPLNISYIELDEGIRRLGISLRNFKNEMNK